MAKDIRVILIKLVDRLHNMRTLAYHTPEKQRKIASETLQVYAPIAHRLGLAEIKNELEDLSFLYLKPENYHEIASLVEAKKAERQSIVDAMIAEIKEMLEEHNFRFRIFGRCKHLYSIYNKMITKNKRFDEILDLYAIRIITETELNCYEILGYIHAQYRPVNGRLKDYIAMPKMNMYQSLHTTILDSKGNIFEVQIRTEAMDEIAERGIAAHWSYKEGKKYNSVSEQKEIENKLGINPLVGEVIVTGENNGLTARIYPDQDVVKATGLDEEAVKTSLDLALKEYNKKQPTYRQIISLVVRKNPFHRNATGKIVRADAEMDSLDLLASR
jgi:GTP pyrophosphokinase